MTGVLRFRTRLFVTLASAGIHTLIDDRFRVKHGMTAFVMVHLDPVISFFPSCFQTFFNFFQTFLILLQVFDFPVS